MGKIDTVIEKLEDMPIDRINDPKLGKQITDYCIENNLGERFYTFVRLSKNFPSTDKAIDLLGSFVVNNLDEVTGDFWDNLDFQKLMVSYCIQNRDHVTYGHLVKMSGISPDAPVEREMLERYRADHTPLVENIRNIFYQDLVGVFGELDLSESVLNNHLEKTFGVGYRANSIVCSPDDLVDLCKSLPGRKKRAEEQVLSAIDKYFSD